MKQSLGLGTRFREKKRKLPFCLCFVYALVRERWLTAQKSRAVRMRYAILGNNLEIILPRSTLRNVWRSVRVLTLRRVVLYNKIKNIYGPKVAYLCMNAIRISLSLTMILHFCFSQARNMCYACVQRTKALHR